MIIKPSTKGEQRYGLFVNIQHWEQILDEAGFGGIKWHYLDDELSVFLSVIRILFIFFGLILAVPTMVCSQYSLQEIGVSAGAGLSIPMEYPSAKMALGWHGKVFLSHYACGKRYGIHADLGIRSAGVVLPRSAFSQGMPGETFHIRMNWIDGGFYFKIRPHEYHRPVEPALLAGIKFAYSPFVTMNKRSLQSNSEISINRFQAGFHVSGFFKRKIGAQSIYLQPGFEFYPFPALSLNTPPGNVSGMYVFIAAGYSLWNSKNHKPSKG